jgi:hypothetical protein
MATAQTKIAADSGIVLGAVTMLTQPPPKKKRPTAPEPRDPSEYRFNVDSSAPSTVQNYPR